MTTKLRVQDIHSEGVSEKFDELTLKDLDRLLLKKDQFKDTGCPACHHMDVTYAFEHQGLGYRRCLSCEMLYISPAPTEEMHLDYVITSSAMTYWREHMPPSMRETRRPMYRERVNYSLDVLKRLGNKAEVSFEIGAGNGEFAEELAKASDLQKIVLLEPQDLNLKENKIQVLQGGFEKMKNLESKFDVVFAWEVIEHILEPDFFLQLVRQALKPGAPFILSTPNESSVETRSLGKDSSNILFDHVRLYNPEAISELLRRNGFRILEICTPGQLDVERMQNKLKNDPSYFKNNPSLEFVLNQGREVTDKFQKYLTQNLQSSHMRVVAIVDSEWKGSHTPLLNQSRLKVSKASSKDSTAQPTKFNEVVLPHTGDVHDPYPPKLIKHVLHDLVGVKSGKMLDLGGGSGLQSLIASKLGFEVISLDREPAIHNIPSIVCDFGTEALPLEDNSIDVVFCKSVIEHFYVRELPHVMNEVMRVLKPGGKFVIMTPDWEYNTQEFFKIFTHVTPYTKDSLAQCLKMYGFDKVNTQNLIQLPLVWENKAAAKFSKLVSYLPLPRKAGKWVRWSKEQVLLGICSKPEA